MLEISTGAARGTGKVLALPVILRDDQPSYAVPLDGLADVTAELDAYLVDLEHPGRAGTVNRLPRPGREPAHILLVGIGDGGEAGWRSAGAALTRAAKRHPAVIVRVPRETAGPAAHGLAEGAWLASYRYRLGEPKDEPALRRIILDTDTGEREERAPASPAAANTRATDVKVDVDAAIARARIVVDAVILARDLTNTPSLQKSPKWLAERIVAAASRRAGVTATVHDEAFLREHSFGGILAVGAGSARPPRLVELSWRPRGARTHVLLVGKGITFDSGGISIKPNEGMKLMRKDMGGAAAVCATVLAVADLGLPVRVTALAPLAENLVSGSATRPGDVIAHYGGLTSEILNTDAEGRLVLGDAIAYGVRRGKPDVVVDLATLTGAQNVALGKRIAALFSHDDTLAAALTAAGDEVDERMWRLPLVDDYLPLIASAVADQANASSSNQAGAVTAALFLREFTGSLRERWAHLDMSAPAWSDKNDGPLVKGATGWGVRLLIRWLATL